MYIKELASTCNVWRDTEVLCESGNLEICGQTKPTHCVNDIIW